MTEITTDLFGLGLENAIRALVGLTCVFVCPVIVAGIVMALTQTVFQIQEQSLSTFPKLIAFVGGLYWGGRWGAQICIALFAESIDALRVV